MHDGTPYMLTQKMRSPSLNPIASLLCDVSKKGIKFKWARRKSVNLIWPLQPKFISTCGFAARLAQTGFLAMLLNGDYPNENEWEQQISQNKLLKTVNTDVKKGRKRKRFSSGGHGITNVTPTPLNVQRKKMQKKSA